MQKIFRCRHRHFFVYLSMGVGENLCAVASSEVYYNTRSNSCFNSAVLKSH